VRRSNSAFVAFLGIILIGAPGATAEGAVTEWHPDDNPHVLTTDLVIGSGDILRIFPGAEVRLDPGVTLWIDGGRLEANGADGNPILFTRNQTDTEWGVIAFQSSSLNNVISHTILEYSSNDPTLSPDYGGAVFLDESSTLLLEHSEVRNTGFEGLYAQDDAELIVRDSYIHDTTRQGINVKWGASARVQRCELHTIAKEVVPRNDGIELTGDGNSDFFEISDCLIYDIGDDGIDLDLDLDATITNNVIHGCGDKGISVSMGSRATLTNNLVYDCFWGLAIQSGADVDAANCTIYDTHYGIRAIIDDQGWPGGTADVKNFIIWNTTSQSVTLDTASTVTATYCNFDDAYAGAGNISLYPMFVDPVDGDFHLLPLSPCIDSGSSDWPAPDRDLDGDARVDDGDVPNTGGGTIDYYDMGIDEYVDPTNAVEAGIETLPGAILTVVPNPAVRGSALLIRMSTESRVTLRLFDATGRLLQERMTGRLGIGEHALPLLDPTAPRAAIGPGVYFLKLQGRGFRSSAKFVLP